MKISKRKRHKRQGPGWRWKPSKVSLKSARRAGIMAGSAMSLAMVMGGSAQALNFPVTDTGDSGAGTLRAAIVAANLNPGPDTIDFDASFDSPQTIDLTSGSLYIDGEVTIEGPGSHLLTIDGGELDRIFTIVDGAESGIDVGISGMTLTGGRTPEGDLDGGGILSFGCDLTLTDTVITGNVADDDPADGAEGSGLGGGVLVSGGSLTVSDSVISDNTAGQDGDGILQSVGIGGGILALGADVLIENSIISGNKALNVNAAYVAGGGGVSVFGSANLTIQRSTISANVDGNAADNGSAISYGRGGGVSFVSDGQLLIEESTISGNVAGNAGTANYTIGEGGGLYSGSPFDEAFEAEITIVNSTISGNIAGNAGTIVDGAEGRGGGLAVLAGATVESSTIVDNHAISDFVSLGGGILDGGEGSTTELHNTVVADNTADLGPDLLGEFNAGYSLIENQNDATINVDPAGTVLSGPAGLGPLAANGGPTETHAITQAIPALFNTGDPVDCPANDQRGVMRPQQGRCDIGAFELEVPLEGLLEFFDDAVEEGDLQGSGNGKSAPNRLKTFRHWLDNAVKLFAAGNIPDACSNLQSALDRTDGVAPPPDFVEGDAADDLAAAIAAARAGIGCE